MGGCIAKVVDVYLEDLGRTIGSGSARDVRNHHLFFNGMLGKGDLVVNEVLG